MSLVASYRCQRVNTHHIYSCFILYYMKLIFCNLGVGAAVLNGLLYAVGGFDCENRLRTVECYCPIKDRWKFVSSMHTPRSGAGVVSLNG